MYLDIIVVKNVLLTETYAEKQQTQLQYDQTNQQYHQQFALKKQKRPQHHKKTMLWTLL